MEPIEGNACLRTRLYAISDAEFTTDLEYMPSMDSAYHYWLQEQYDRQREAWEKKYKARKAALSRQKG